MVSRLTKSSALQDRAQELQRAIPGELRRLRIVDLGTRFVGEGVLRLVAVKLVRYVAPFQVFFELRNRRRIAPVVLRREVKLHGEADLARIGGFARRNAVETDAGVGLRDVDAGRDRESASHAESEYGDSTR